MLERVEFHAAHERVEIRLAAFRAFSGEETYLGVAFAGGGVARHKRRLFNGEFYGVGVRSLVFSLAVDGEYVGAAVRMRRLVRAFSQVLARKDHKLGAVFGGGLDLFVKAFFGIIRSDVFFERNSVRLTVCVHAAVYALRGGTVGHARGSGYHGDGICGGSEQRARARRKADREQKQTYKRFFHCFFS